MEQAIVINEPSKGSIIKGGMVQVSGLAHTDLNTPLNIELVSVDGRTLGFRLAAFSQTDSGEYGRIIGGDLSHTDKVDYSFNGVAGDVTVAYEVWDVDLSDEVEILMNGMHLDYTATTPDEAWSGLMFVVIPDDLVFDSGTNVLTFNNTYNPPKTYWWGVGKVSLE